MRPIAILDYDGTIVDSLDVFYQALVQALRRNGYEQIRNRYEFLRLFEGNLWSRLVDVGIPRQDHATLVAALAHALDVEGQYLKCFPGVPPVLRHLAAQAPVYIVTSNVASVVSAFLTQHRMDRHIKAVLGTESGHDKVSKIRRIQRLHPEMPCVYVGDTMGDIAEAKQAGVTVVAACWGWHGKGLLAASPVDAFCDSPTDLIRVINSLFETSVQVENH